MLRASLSSPHPISKEKIKVSLLMGDSLLSLNVHFDESGKSKVAKDARYMYKWHEKEP